ncbi:MAG: 50S ribosomal protein L9 [Puniceicoccales bacterium]|jgi:large subunit ribosomal protein L9|nr:50S ribosomal protein L9 [Puniceicoccales bacterium]
MATADILLLQKVEHLGYEGDVVTVRAGYARNYLLPQKLAISVTRSNRKQIEALGMRRRTREEKELREAETLAEQIRALSLTFSVKVGERGKMFGAITVNDLAHKIAEHGIAIDRKKIHLEQPIKTLGQSSAKIKLHHSITVDLQFAVVAEESVR